MPLNATQRERGWQWFQLHRSVDPSTAPAAKFTKVELRTALDAAVLWIENNQAAYVASLAGTAFAGAGSTADEKRRLFLAAFRAVFDYDLEA